MRVNGGGAAQPEIKKNINKTANPLLMERAFCNNREMIVIIAFIIERLFSLVGIGDDLLFPIFDIQ